MVRVFGHDVAPAEPMAVRRLLGYVPQQLSADAALTGRENVALFARLFDVPRRERAGRVDEALDAMGLADAADRLAKTYSGGMVRRLELAQALVSAPRAAGARRADRSASTRSPATACGSGSTRSARATGMTVLVTTHYMEEADQHCDRVALMHRGRIRALGTPAELKARARARRHARGRLPPLHRRHARRRRREGRLPRCPQHPPHRPPPRLTRPARGTVACGGPAPGRARSASSSCRSCATTAPSSSPAPSSPRCGCSIFGKTFSQIHAIPTGGVPYLDFLAPGILAQSALFIAIFYGIQIIWERDAGVLAKLMVTPTPGPRWSPARRSPPGCGRSPRRSS